MTPFQQLSQFILSNRSMTKYVKRLFFKERGRNRTKAFQPLKIKLASEVFF